jgi:hypothetical protein
MKYRGAVASLLLLATPATSQIREKPTVVSGTCDAKSGVTVNGSEKSTFGCDIAVITRAQSGAILIQFTDKRGDDGRILGFAGTIEGKQGFGADTSQILEVDRFYLAGGARAVEASHGTCILNWSGLQRTGGHLLSVLCAARGQVEGSDIKAIAALKAR